MAYSTDAELELLFHGIATTPGYAASLSDFDDERELANEWLNSQLRDRYTVPFTGTVDKMIVLAEANYAVGIILKSNSTTAGFEFSTYQPFFQEAKTIVSRLRAMRTGPDLSTNFDQILTTKAGVEPTVKKAKFNRDGDRINPTLAPRKLDYF
jgi:hypothetical protein